MHLLRRGFLVTMTPDADGVIRLGRYELHERIGLGAMAAVYLGIVRSSGGFQRTVAIKVLHEHLADEPAFRAMFLDEARIAARVHHPNVVSTLDIWQDGDVMLLVMEYIEGWSLRELTDSKHDTRERLPMPVTLRIITDVLAGLHAAHELVDEHGEALNLVHRDVSPPNLLVGRDGVSRLTDFGVVRARRRFTRTQVQTIKGKLAYMPPEQAMGRKLDRRADVFAAGIVLWELLTGQRLFRGKGDVQLFREVVHGAAYSPREIDPSLPVAIDDVCMRALAMSRSDRPATALHFRNAILEAARRANVRIADPEDVAEYLQTGHYTQRLTISKPLPAPIPSSPHSVTPVAISAPLPAPPPPPRFPVLTVLAAAALVAGLAVFAVQPPEASFAHGPADFVAVSDAFARYVPKEPAKIVQTPAPTPPAATATPTEMLRKKPTPKRRYRPILRNYPRPKPTAKPKPKTKLSVDPLRTL
jgi:serine/threonine protein kinase